MLAPVLNVEYCFQKLSVLIAQSDMYTHAREHSPITAISADGESIQFNLVHLKWRLHDPNQGGIVFQIQEFNSTALNA